MDFNLKQKIIYFSIILILLVIFIVIINSRLTNQNQQDINSIKTNFNQEKNIITTNPNTLINKFDKDFIFSIVQKDKEYNEFKLLEPNFVVKDINCFMMDQNVFQEQKVTNETINTLSQFIEDINFNKNTYYCELFGNQNNKYDLISIINIEREESLFIASLINIKPGELIV